MTTQSKLETLKAMVRKWDNRRGIVDAWDICQFLVDNLDLGEQEGKE